MLGMAGRKVHMHEGPGDLRTPAEPDSSWGSPARRAVTVQAMTAFGLRTKALRWDLTSVLKTGAYPEEEQAAGYAQVRYGYSSGEQKQIRYLQVTTDDGAVPVWDAPYDGNTTDVATVIETMQALRKYARCQDFVLLGDSKLLSAPNRR